MLTRAIVGCAAAAMLVHAASDDENLASRFIAVTPEGPKANSVNGAPSLSFSFMHHGMPAWHDLAGSAAVDPPGMIVGVPTAVPNTFVPAGTTVTWTCPPPGPGFDHDGCNAWVWVYRCPWSCPGPTDELLPPGSDWAYTMCAPRFVNGVSPYKHRMVGFRYDLVAGEVVSFTLGGEVQNVMFGIELVKDCSAHMDAYSCTSAPEGKCQWTGRCVAYTCKSPGQGPPPPCLECALDNCSIPHRP